MSGLTGTSTKEALAAAIAGIPGQWFDEPSQAIANLPANIPMTSKAGSLLGRRWPGIAGIPAVMTGPPVVTLSAASAATSVAGSAERSLLSGSFPNAVYVPGLVNITGAPIKVTQGTLGSGIVSGSWVEEGASYTQYGIITDSPKLEFVISGGGFNFRIMVNRQPVTANAVAGPPPDGNLYRILVDFATVRQFREIALETQGNLRGVQVLPTDTVYPAPRRGPRVVMFGDSFGEGTGATDKMTAFPQVLSQVTGWDILPLAEGATGYKQDNIGSARTAATGHTNDCINAAPDAVLWALGVNDWNGFSAAVIQAAAGQAFDQVMSGLPGIPQIVLGIFVGTGNQHTNPSWIAGQGAIRAAALARGLPFVDIASDGKYLYGTGKVGTPASDGPADFLVSSDGTHPSPAGHTALALRIFSQMAAVLAG